MTRTSAKTPTTANHKHSHALTAIDAAIAGHTHPDLDAATEALWAAVADVGARVAALEAPPVVVPPPDPPPVYPVDDLVAAIAATPNGGILDCGGAAFAAPDGGLNLNRPIVLRDTHLTSTVKAGSATTATLRVTATGVVVEGMSVTGGFVGILLDRVAEVLVRAYVKDVVYAGILSLSATDCLVENAVIDGVRPVSGVNEHNAYGVTFTNLAGQPLSKRMTVRDSFISNIPTWHGLDTHGGEDISFIDNEITACRRGIFLTDSPPRVICTGNHLTCPTPAERSQTPPGGAPAAYLTDVRGISIVGGSGEITGNTGIGYPAGRWWNPISAGNYVTTGNTPAIP